LGAVLGGKPEIIDLDVLVSDFRLLDPKRWILAGLSLNASDSEILRVDPNFAAIQELVFRLRQQVDDVAAALGSVLEAGEFKIVIFAAQPGLALVVPFGGFLLAFQKFLENMIDNELGAGLRDYGEFLGIGSAEVDLDHHFGIAITGEAAILHAIDALAFELAERCGSRSISLLEIFNDLLQGQRGLLHGNFRSLLGRSHPGGENKAKDNNRCAYVPTPQVSHGFPFDSARSCRSRVIHDNTVCGSGEVGSPQIGFQPRLFSPLADDRKTGGDESTLDQRLFQVNQKPNILFHC